MEHLVFYLIVFFVTASFLLETVLDRFNLQTWRQRLPGFLKGWMDPEAYQKARQYHAEHSRFEDASRLFHVILLLLILFFGGFAWLDGVLQQYTMHPVILPLLYFGVLALASDWLNIPFSAWRTFVIEERYGFNQTSVATFITDKLKGYLLGALIGGGLLMAFIWFYLQTGAWFWLWMWLLFTGFTYFFTMFYTAWIMPLFNKLTPLEDGELRQAIEKYCQRVDFPLKNIYVIDGSKRSSKANAFFSGLGRQKSIVLFDTLIEKHNTEGLVAILAHEVGHYKHRHIRTRFVLSSLQMLVMLLLLSFCIDHPLLAKALGAEAASFHLGLLAFTLLYTPVSTLTGIAMNYISRKHEFEADRYACTTADGKALGAALKQLSRDHLSNLHPHPAYVFVHYSHPPVTERLAAMDRVGTKE